MLFLFSNDDFSIAENEFKKVLNENTKVLCFSGADMDWQINNPKELLQGGNYYNENGNKLLKKSTTDLLVENKKVKPTTKN